MRNRNYCPSSKTKISPNKALKLLPSVARTGLRYAAASRLALRYASRGNAMLTKILVSLLFALPVISLAAELEFEGAPEVKVLVMDGVAQTESVPRQKAREFRAVVVREGDQFYWASRNNEPLVKRESGAYITYVAASGAGYVRVLIPAMRKLHDSLPQDQRDQGFVYMEHLVNQMGSITYFGK